MISPFRVLFVYPNLQMINLLPSNISLLSACLKEKGIYVDLFDTTFYRIDKESVDDKRVDYLQLRPFDLAQYGIKYKDTDVITDFIEKVHSYKPDLIAITIVEDTLPLTINLLKALPNRSIPVIAGGVHVTLAPEQVISFDEIDMICQGEGEYSLQELCERLSRGKSILDIPNIWIKKDGEIIKNQMRPVVDLNTLPYNDFSIYQRERFYRPMQGKVYRMVPIEVDRGCPYSCTYCSAPSLREIYRNECGDKYYRIKSLERIMNELDHQISKYDVEYIYFNSETFLAGSVERFEKFAEEYKNRIGLPFWCQTRIETITEEKIKLLEDMGCNRLSIGIEHGNEVFRRKMLGKTFTNQQVLDAFKALNNHKIPVTVNNMIGFPDETRELVFDTIRLNRQINSDSTNLFIFTPYHGTTLRKYAMERGYLSENEQVNGIMQTTLSMPQLTEESIIGLLRTFPLYIKMPEERFPEIERAEKLTKEGNAIFDQLANEYKKKYWQSVT